MAEGYGKIYESTWWGDTTNSIYWGSVYANLAGGVVSDIVNSFAARVVADGGSVESTACLETDLTYLTNNPIVPDFTGLLNDYSGAAAAYSLRLLDNTYSGNAVRVRRASDNTEQDIGFANNELDTTSLETFCSGTDGFVTTWYDQSGNAVNAAQATASSQPKIVASGSTILENGKASIEFNGSSNFMTSPSVALSTNNIALFNVLKLNSSTFATWFSYGGYVSNGFLIQRPNQSYARYATDGTSVKDFNDYSSLPSTTNQILISLIDYDSSSSLYIDNVNQGTGLISASLNSSKTIELGRRTDNAAQYTPMNAQEFIFYPTDESSNRTGIETNINTHYSIY